MINNGSNESTAVAAAIDLDKGDDDDVSEGKGDAAADVDAPSNEVLLMVQGRNSMAKNWLENYTQLSI